MKRFFEITEGSCYSLGLALLALSFVLVPQNWLLAQVGQPINGPGCTSVLGCNAGCNSVACLTNANIAHGLCNNTGQYTGCNCRNTQDPANCSICVCAYYLDPNTLNEECVCAL
jgi:hypothetical protein